MLRLTVFAVCVMSGGYTAISGAEPDLYLTDSCPQTATEHKDITCLCRDRTGLYSVTWRPKLPNPIRVLHLLKVNRSRDNEMFTCSVFGAKPGGASVTFTLRFPPLITRRPASTTTATAAATATAIPGTDASTPNLVVSSSTTSLHDVADSRDGGPSVAIVTGGVVGGVAVIIIVVVVVVVVLFVKKKRGKSQYGAAERPTSEANTNDDFDGHVNILYEIEDTARPALQRLPTSGSAPVHVSTNHSDGTIAGLPWNVQPRGDADPVYSNVAVPTSGIPEDHVSTNHSNGATARDLNGASHAQPRVNSDPGYECVGNVAVATPSARIYVQL